ncbi:hypothetical protein TNCV_3159611 [Trichonephila clavipes]|nr:hypothetical protein TNCV_3159611 [Trichonephila clavipes]
MQSSDPRNLVIMVESWLVYHEFEPCSAEDLPCRKAMLIKSVNARPPVDVVWKLREGAVSSGVVLVS